MLGVRCWLLGVRLKLYAFYNFPFWFLFVKPSGVETHHLVTTLLDLTPFFLEITMTAFLTVNTRNGTLNNAHFFHEKSSASVLANPIPKFIIKMQIVILNFNFKTFVGQYIGIFICC